MSLRDPTALSHFSVCSFSREWFCFTFHMSKSITFETKKKLGHPTCAPGVLTRPLTTLAFDIRSYVKSESKVSQKLKISYGQKGAPWALNGGRWEWSK